MLLVSPSHSAVPSTHDTSHFWVPISPAHTPLLQSIASVQGVPVPHPSQRPPPQSNPFSVPLMMPSSQLGATQTPSVQTLLSQSRGARHGSPGWQPLHMPPPQSTQVSSSSCAPSSQPGAWQKPSMHWPSSQSVCSLQPCPSLQPLQVPPQSMSVSPTPSSVISFAQCSSSGSGTKLTSGVHERATARPRKARRMRRGQRRSRDKREL